MLCSAPGCLTFAVMLQNGVNARAVKFVQYFSPSSLEEAEQVLSTFKISSLPSPHAVSHQLHLSTSNKISRHTEVKLAPQLTL